MSLAIFPVGTAVPATVIDQAAALRLARALGSPTPEQDTWLPSMYHGTGIVTRHVALPPALVGDVLAGTRESGSPFLPTGHSDDRGPSTSERMRHYAALAPPLAAEASRQALVNSGLTREDITHLVTVSCTGFFAPGLDHHLIEALRLRPTTERVQVGFMGCHGALNGLRVAQALSHGGARVLLCAAELCSLHYYYGWCPGKMVANAIFADGAAAVVGVPHAEAPAGAWRVLDTGSCYLPDSAAAMTWTVGDHGFEMTLSKNVPALIARHLRPWLEGWLHGRGLAVRDVGSWAIHPGGPRILSAVEEAMGLSRDDTGDARAVFAAHGNMSSPTVLFILGRLMARQAPRPCVALGLGPGLAAEVALLG